MKVSKIITLLITATTLSLLTLNIANARDCSNPKGFHEKMMCKLGDVGGTMSSNTDSSDKPAKSGNSIWKKIKNFGGKNIGSEG